MGLFRKSIKHSKSSKDLDTKIKNLDEDLKRAGIIAKEDGEIFCVEKVQENNNFKIVDRIDLVESAEERLYDWRETIVESSTKDTEEDRKEILEHHNITKVEYYISESNKELILLRDQVFEEISKETLLNLPEIKNKISKVLEIYEQIQEGLLNEPPETKNDDPLTPLNQNFITVDELNKHYNLFINRIQEQIATIGGGGETKLQYLDDIVGIATNPSSYNGKFLKYNHTIGKFEFSSVGAGSQDLNDTLLLGNTSSLGMSVGIVTSTKVRVGGSTTFSEELVVTGDARVTGILTIGTGSITLDGSDDSITIGSGLTITSSGNANYSGVITATSFSGDGSNLTGISATFTGAASTITNTQISNWNTAYSWGDHSVVGYATEGYVTNAVAGVVTFSGNYNDLTNKPTIPADTGDLTNNVGFITAGSLVGYATEGYVDNAVVGFVTSGIVVGYATEGYVTNAVAGVVTFSGNYNDLTNKPTIPSDTGDLTNNVGFITAGASGSSLTGIVTSITAGSGISINQSTGNVTITSVGGGGGTTYWESTATGIHTTSNVGIGTTNATSELTVQGRVEVTNLSVSGLSTFKNSLVVDKNYSLYFGLSGSTPNGLQVRHTNSLGAEIANVSNLGGDDRKITIQSNRDGDIVLKGQYSNRAVFSGYGVTITGTTDTDKLNVSGVSTFSSRYVVDAGLVQHTSQAGIASAIDSFDTSTSDFLTAEYTVHVGYGTYIQSQKVLVMQNGQNAYAQEYGVMYQPDIIVSFGATMSGTTVTLQATPETGISGVTTYRFVRGSLL